MPYGVNDNLDPNNFPPASNIRQAVDILATQVKELSGKSSWKDKPDYSLTNILTQPSLKGDKGDTGLQGIQGVKGDKGDTSQTGYWHLGGEEGRRQRAEGRRFAIQCRLQTYTDCRTPNQRFWSGASTLTPFGHSRGQESEFPSAFCLLPSAFLAKATATGSTAYTTLATVTIQPSALTVNSVIRIIAIASYLAGGVKTFRIRIGSVVIFSVSLSALGGSLVLEKLICFQNSLSANVTPPSGLNGVGTSSNQPLCNVANFNSPQTIIFEVQNTLVTDTTILESALVEIV